MNHQFKSLEKPKNNAFLKENITLVVQCCLQLVTWKQDISPHKLLEK